MDRLAGDIRSIRTQQEGNHRCHLVRRPMTAERNALDGGLPARRIERTRRAFLLADITRDDAVDGDTLWCELCRQRPRQAFEPELGGGRGGEMVAAKTKDVGEKRADGD